MKVKILKDTFAGKKPVVRGEIVEVSNADCKLLLAFGCATLNFEEAPEIIKEIKEDTTPDLNREVSTKSLRKK